LDQAYQQRIAADVKEIVADLRETEDAKRRHVRSRLAATTVVSEEDIVEADVKVVNVEVDMVTPLVPMESAEVVVVVEVEEQRNDEAVKDTNTAPKLRRSPRLAAKMAKTVHKAVKTVAKGLCRRRR
jgi:hypothetical protein